MLKIFFTGILLVHSFTVHAGLYRWVDDAGNVHFSDKVPAAASKKAHAKLNKAGVVKKKVDPESLQAEKDQLALIEKERLEQERLKEIERKKVAKVMKRDNYLLSTYENKSELIRSFESKIQMVEGNSKIIESQNKILTKKLVNLQSKTPQTEHAKKAIEAKIVDLNVTLQQYKKALLENEKQIEQLSKNYSSDLKRYTEISQ